MRRWLVVFLLFTVILSPLVAYTLIKSNIDKLHDSEVLSIENDWVGFSVHSLSANEAQLVNESGAHWIRIDASDNFSIAVKNAKAYNAQVLGILDSWMFNGTSTFTLEEWRDNVTYYVSQHAAYVDAWELWNEPANPKYPLLNLNIMTPENMSRIVDFYFLMVQIASPIIRQYDPTAKIALFGGLNLWSGDDPNLVLDKEFAQQLVAMNISQYGDAISVHAYPWTEQVQPWIWEKYDESLAYYRGLFTSNKTLEIWVTETGQPIEFGGEQGQAQYMTEALQHFQGKVAQLFWYSLTDSAADQNKSFGLIGKETPRLAYYELQSRMHQLAAASYIENRYDARVGLVSESEDNGSNVPDGTPCWRTFWVYSDNLWASQALKPFQLQMAANISETVARYLNKCGKSQLFEVVLGTIIPTPLHAHTNVKVDSLISNGLNCTVWADRHQPQDGGIFFDADQYADLCFYLSLNCALQLNDTASEQWFRTGESYWNGHGFFDKAANESATSDQDKRYQNYKLGLYLFTAKATGFNSLIYDAVENTAWSYQEANGGIAAQSHLNGTIFGTANVETTSILLLAYDNEALAKFTRIGAYYYPWWGIPSNNHWNADIKGTPSLGYYNSNDSRVANQQILFAKQGGIDFFAVSWIGEGTWHEGDFATIDQNLRNGLLEAPLLSDFRFCLFYETILVKYNAFNEQKNFSDIFLNDIGYAAQQYFGNPSYLKVDGSPVLFIYNVPYLYVNSTEPEVHTLLDSARQEAAISGFKLYIIGDLTGGPSPPDLNSPLLYSLNATTSYYFNDQANNWDEVLGNAALSYPQWLSKMNSKGIDFVPDAYPGFNNTNNAGASEPWTVLSRSATSFGQMLKIAINCASSAPRFVMVTSWNEWMEGTQIEPSVEDGELFLDAVYDAVNTPMPTTTPTPAPTAALPPEAIYAIATVAIVAIAATAAVIIKKQKK